MFKESTINNKPEEINKLSHPELSLEVSNHISKLWQEADVISVELQNLQNETKTNSTIEQDTKLKNRLATILNLITISKENNKIEREKPIINLDADPLVPEGFSIEKNIKGGMFEFDPAHIYFYRPSNMKGVDIFETLMNKLVLNANVLDYLMANPEYIPEEWKKEDAIFFWGTIYRDADADLRVRCLYLDNDCWNEGADWLEHYYVGSCPAAMAK